MRRNLVSVTLHRRVTLPRLTWRYLVLNDPACSSYRIPQVARMSSAAGHSDLWICRDTASLHCLALCRGNSLNEGIPVTWARHRLRILRDDPDVFHLLCLR